MYDKLMKSCAEIYEGIKMPEFHSIIIFLMLQAFLCPSFEAYGYFFMLDVVGLDKFTFSALKVYDFVGLLIGVQVFRYYLKDYEVRTLIIAHAVI